MMQQTDGHDMRKVLCVRLDNMGDVLMTTPAWRALKLAVPDRHLTLLASTAGSRLAPLLPDMDDVITYDAPWVKNASDDRCADRDIVYELASRNFDAAVIFTVYSQSPLPAALMCRLAGIPRVLAHCRENPYRLVSHWVRETEPERLRHEVQRQLDLVATIAAVNPYPVLRLATRTKDRCSLYRKLAACGVYPGDTWIVGHCGASAPSRRYPEVCFARAFRQLGNRAGTLVLTGSHAEQDMTARIRHWCSEHVSVLDLAGKLDLGELACLIQDAALLVSNNTGPVHIAAAVGTPVVDLYALTNPQHTPWMVPHLLLNQDVPCRYCYRSVCPEQHHRCLRGVRPGDVCDAILTLSARYGRGMPGSAATSCHQETLPC